MSTARVRAISLMCLLAFPLYLSADLNVDITCPVTIPGSSSIDGPFDTWPQAVWYGSDSLAVLIRSDGQWAGMGAAHNYRNKQWWWSDGYDRHIEQNVDLVVTGRRLDDESILASISESTTGDRDDWPGTVMLVGVEFPSTGCWEIRGEYSGQVVTFVVNVVEEPTPSKRGT